MKAVLIFTLGPIFRRGGSADVHLIESRIDFSRFGQSSKEQSVLASV
jgi:hypothetical protein